MRLESRLTVDLFDLALAGAICLGLWPPTCTGAEDAALRRLRSEYPGASARMSELYGNVAAEGRLVNAENGAGFNVEISVHGGLKLIHMTTPLAHAGVSEVPTTELVYCIGPATKFGLRRRPAEGGDYVIDSMERAEGSQPGAVASKVSQKYYYYAGRFLEASYLPGMNDVTRMLSDPHFKFTSCRQEGQGEDEVVTLRYAYYETVGNGTPWETGLLEFLPGRNWVVRRHEADSFATISVQGRPRKIKFNRSMTVEYADGRVSPPVPSRVTIRELSDGWTLIFDKVTFDASVPVRDFTLEAYGLGAVARPVADPSNSSAIYWVLVLAVVALAAAAWLRIRAR